VLRVLPVFARFSAPNALRRGKASPEEVVSFEHGELIATRRQTTPITASPVYACYLSLVTQRIEERLGFLESLVWVSDWQSYAMSQRVKTCLRSPESLAVAATQKHTGPIHARYSTWIVFHGEVKIWLLPDFAHEFSARSGPPCGTSGKGFYHRQFECLSSKSRKSGLYLALACICSPARWDAICNGDRKASSTLEYAGRQGSPW